MYVHTVHIHLSPVYQYLPTIPTFILTLISVHLTYVSRYSTPTIVILYVSHSNPLTTIRHIDIQFKILSQIAYWFSSEFPPPNRKIYLSTLLKDFFSGRGSVGRAVASDTRDPRFESNHRQILFAINIIKDFFSQKVQVLFTTIKFN